MTTRFKVSGIVKHPRPTLLLEHHTMFELALACLGLIVLGLAWEIQKFSKQLCCRGSGGFARRRCGEPTTGAPSGFAKLLLFVALELWYLQKRLVKLSNFEKESNSIALQRRHPSKTVVIRWFLEEILPFP